MGRLGQGVWSHVSPDASSLEYTGLLCAQAIRLEQASSLAARLEGEGEGQAAGRVRVAVCRGAALLGAWRRVERELGQARALLSAEANFSAFQATDISSARLIPPYPALLSCLLPISHLSTPSPLSSLVDALIFPYYSGLRCTTPSPS